ncbi:unnamed protein product [Arctia plantaginis]|uniref:Attacin n=1 Tax=Arctia plantaginis TaxID=874455 RepID=A0A8S0YP65_ARCPL|nr:unnamed protein product [Arctia plantaginis]
MYSALLSILFIATASAVSLNEESRYGLNGYYDSEHIFDPEFPAAWTLHHHRARRQLGSVFFNSDSTSGANMKLPLAGNNKNMLSALGSVGFDANKHLSSASGGLALDNVRGHGLSLTGTHIPNFGNQLTGAGRLNLFHNQNHDLNANAFLTRNMPTIPQVPNFNTVGGSLDYMFKNKVGASLGASRTPFLQRTDYSASGNLNLFRNPSTSLDFNAGVSKSVSPFMKSSWQPNVGLRLSKYF